MARTRTAHQVSGAKDCKRIYGSARRLHLLLLFRYCDDCISMAAYAVPTESRSCSHRLLALSGTSTAHHRKAQSRGFLMMYGTNTVDEKKRSSLLYGPKVP